VFQLNYTGPKHDPMEDFYRHNNEHRGGSMIKGDFFMNWMLLGCSIKT
jgi:hypothetical protein